MPGSDGDAVARVAAHLHARRAGRGRWMARCPAHADRSPSLAIAAGRDGRVLLHCWAGCRLDAVLQAAGLTMGDLFAGSPTTPQPRPDPRALVAAAERDRRQAALRASERATEDWLRQRWHALEQEVPRLARSLALLPDPTTHEEQTPGAIALTKHFHHLLAEQRLIDRALLGENE